VDATDLT